MKKNKWISFRLTLISLAVFFLVSLSYVDAWAWDTGAFSRSTHWLLVDRGITLLKQTYPGKFPEIDTYASSLQKGCNEEMHEGSPHGGNNWGCSDIKGWWDEAFSSYVNKDKEDAYYKLGIMLHLIADMGVPVHACHIGHGMGHGFSHLDGFETWCNSYWGPEEKKIKDPLTDFNGVCAGDPNYVNPYDYYTLSQKWTLNDIKTIEAPKAVEHVWIGEESYWNPPADTSEVAAQWGSYGEACWDLPIWGWDSNPQQERNMASFRQNATSYVMMWTLHSAMLQFVKVISGEIYDGHGGPLTAGTHYITDNTEVPSGKTLTIDPGANLYFYPGKKITANGTLNANGEINNPIYLISNTDNHGMKLNCKFRLQNGGEFKP